MASSPAEQLRAAERRIAQLEAALARRGELVHSTNAQLLRLSRRLTLSLPRRLAERVATLVLPPRTRRRAAAKYALRALLRLAHKLTGKPLPPPVDWRQNSAQIDPDQFRLWMLRFEPSAADLARQRTTTLERSPVISVVVPTFNTPLPFLEEMVASVQAQTYPHWELVIADGGSTRPGVRERLAEVATADRRVRVHLLEKNLGIVGNSNAAILHARGDFVALLDHDDTLASHALFAVAETLQAHPTADFLYSDEDKLDARGQRCDPHFKPQWSPETLRSVNYVCHLMVLKRDLLMRLGGFRQAYEGAQDHDLALRAGERAECVVHIPQVLYHWRMHAESTAGNNTSKGYAFESGVRAVSDHLSRLRVPATVRPGPIGGTYRVDYALPTQPLVSVIIPNRDQPDFLRMAVESVLHSTYAHHEIVIAENGSTDPRTLAYYDELRRLPQVKIVEWVKAFNYAAINNWAVTHAAGEYVLFLNNDIRSIHPDWLENMVKQAQSPGVGAVGARLLYDDDTVQHAGVVLGIGGVAGHPFLKYPGTAPGYANRMRYAHNVAIVTAACLLMPRKVFDAVGGFDEGYVLAFNDVDLGMQILRHGYRCVWTPDASLHHFESKTRGYEDTPEKIARFRRETQLFQLKWAAELAAGDPYYSPHFRLDRTDYCLKT